MWLLRPHLLLVVAYSLLTFSISVSSNLLGEKKAKEFSLFSVVTFPNSECTSSTTVTGGATDGTCFTSTECTDKGGTKSGNCASGFGVCCVFLNTASSTTSTITQNRTRVRNAEYPSVTTATAATTIGYTVSKMSSDICQLRLDFTTFQLGGPANTQEQIAVATGSVGGTHCVDTFRITTTDVAAWSNAHSSTLCGVLTGEHLYVELSPTAADAATIAISTAISTTQPPTVANRKWDVKISQIECHATYRAPNGCDRYMMEDYGKIISYNFRKADSGATTGAALTNSNSGIELAMQRITTCIRRSKGMCCVEYLACSSYNSIALIDVANGINAADNGASATWNEAFSIDLNTAPYLTEQTYTNIGMIDSLCTGDYVEIPSSWSAGCGGGTGSSRATVNTRYCGARFGANLGQAAAAKTRSTPVCDCSEPFIVRHQTDDVNDFGGIPGSNAVNPDSTATATLLPRGFCLDYKQMPCWQ